MSNPDLTPDAAAGPAANAMFVKGMFADERGPVPCSRRRAAGRPFKGAHCLNDLDADQDAFDSAVWRAPQQGWEEIVGGG